MSRSRLPYFSTAATLPVTVAESKLIWLKFISIWASSERWAVPVGLSLF